MVNHPPWFASSYWILLVIIKFILVVHFSYKVHCIPQKFFNETISLKNKWATCVASLVFQHGIKWGIFINMYINTSVESFHWCILNKPKKNYIVIDYHGLLGMGKGVYNPTFLPLTFACWHTLHFPIHLCTSYLIFGEKWKWSSYPSVFPIEKCPANPPLWFSCIKFSLIEEWWIHKLFFLNNTPYCNINSLHVFYLCSQGSCMLQRLLEN